MVAQDFLCKVGPLGDAIVIPQMKVATRWFLFEYQHGKLVILSKPFKTKQEAEEARQKYPERERKRMGIGRS